jgi:hypothetical protein
MSDHVNEKISQMTGERHSMLCKGSLIEHNPHGHSPAERLADIEEGARKKQKQLVGDR